jgi:hypothetical protein
MAAGASMFLILVFLTMLIMLIAGMYLIIASRRSGGGRTYPACGACGYDLSGSVGSVPRCPECGADFKVVGITPPSGRRSKPMLITGILLLILPLTCAGWVGAMAIARLVRPAPSATFVTPAPLPPPDLGPSPAPPMPQSADEAEIDTTG